METLALVAAAAGGIVVYVLRWLQDRPTSKVLRERVEDLEKARKEEKEEREELKIRNAQLEAKAAAALEMALQKAKVEELHVFVKEATVQGAQEHRQITTVLSSLSAEHEKMMQTSGRQSDVLTRIADRLAPKAKWDRTTERREAR